MRRATSRHLPALVLLTAFGSGCGSNQGSVVAAVPGAPAAAVSFSVSGPSSVRLGSLTQFTDTDTSGTILWLVNGVQGGSAALGTISSAGLYTAPTAFTSSGTVTISAELQAGKASAGSQQVALMSPVPVLNNAVAAQVGSSQQYSIAVSGTGFLPTTEILVDAVAAPDSMTDWSSGTALVTLPAGTTSIAVSLANPNPDGSTSSVLMVPVSSVAATATQAGRLLDQATFGPTIADIQHVESIGLSAYLGEQFAQPVTAMPVIATNLPFCSDALLNPADCAWSEWWHVVIRGSDQLRQRVAFALSQIFVVSMNPLQGQAIPAYNNILAADAFSNFLKLMKDVTLSPAMGEYLNLRNSIKATKGQLANENYAREFMQLFTLGVYQLNQDGSLQLDSNGQPLSTYTQDQVEAFARAYTGWTEPMLDGSMPASVNWVRNWNAQMVPLDFNHDMTSKILLGGTTLPAGQTTEQDLDGALANIFNQPNVGPFIGKQLIQHLVKSQPSPAYIARVAAVFADNGSGVRGDMQAVITAILMDPEARAGDTAPAPSDGRLREPALFFTAMVRGLGFVDDDPQDSLHYLSVYSSYLGETPYFASSVFNFFPPDYVIPGTSINAPEFGLENNAAYLERLSLSDSVATNHLFQVTADLSDTSLLGSMAADPGALTDYLSLLFLHGQMSPEMRTEIVNTITPLTSAAQRARIAVYLVITSPGYMIIQ